MKRSGFAVLVFAVLVWFVAHERDVIRPPSKRMECGHKIYYADCSAVPDELAAVHDVGTRKALFLETVLPLVLKSNSEVAEKRSRVERIVSARMISARDEDFLRELATDYLIEGDDLGQIAAELLLRVDVLPPSLVLAQAAAESGWGGSRFSREGNNLFGLRTPSGLGLRPQRQADGMVFRVSRFASLQSCIDYYLWTINTHPSYDELRQLRRGLACPYDSLVLAQGLEEYSEQGTLYVDLIRGIIDHNDLKKYDCYCLADGSDAVAAMKLSLASLGEWLGCRLRLLNMFDWE